MADANPDHITLKVVDANGAEVFFKIKKQTPLRKMMNAFCERQGVSANSVRFLYDGKRITGDATPQELDMEEGDAIDVVVEQTGGFIPYEQSFS